DENPANPSRYPGDYDVFQGFDVTADAPMVMPIDVTRLIHLTAPWDNGASMEGMLSASWEKKPSLDTPLYSLDHSLSLTFTWDPVAEEADYDYCVLNSAQGARGPDVVRGK